MMEELNTLADAVEASPAALERDLVTSICAALAAARPAARALPDHHGNRVGHGVLVFQ